MGEIYFNYENLNKNERFNYDRMNESEKANFERLWVQLESQKAKMQQQINKSKVRYQREKVALAKKERSERTHRLIERGAILEKFIPEDFNNNEIVMLLKKCIASEGGLYIIEDIKALRSSANLTS